MPFTPIFWDGFEDGTTKRWDAEYAGSVSTSYQVSGSYSYSLGGAASYLIKIIQPETEYFLSMWIRPHTSFQTSGIEILSFYDQTDKRFLIIGSDNAGRLRYWDKSSGSIVKTDTGVYCFHNSTWANIQVRVAVNSTAGTITIKVGNVAIVEAEKNLSAFTQITKVAFGCQGGLTYGSVNHEYLDDIVIGTGDWPGILRIWRGVPDGDGTTSEWTPSVAGSHFEAVDETPPSSADYISTNDVDKTDLFTAPEMGFGLNEIFGVAVCSHMQTEGAHVPQHAAQQLVIGSTTYAGATATVPADGILTDFWAVNPATGLAWTQPDVQNAEIGIKSLT